MLYSVYFKREVYLSMLLAQGAVVGGLSVLLTAVFVAYNVGLADKEGYTTFFGEEGDWVQLG